MFKGIASRKIGAKLPQIYIPQMYLRCGDTVSRHFLKHEAITGFAVPQAAWTHIPGRMGILLGQTMVGGFATLFLDILRIPVLLGRTGISYYYFFVFVN